MTYRVEVRPRALKQLFKLPEDVGTDVGRAINDLAYNPRPPGVKKMVGNFVPPQWRIKVRRDYRVVYNIHDDQQLVVVLRAGHRRDVYD